MAEYGARMEEFDKGVAAAQQADIEYERSGGEPIVLARYITFREFLSGSYMDWRDKALNEGLEILKYESTSATASQQQSKWSDYYSSQGQQAFQKITDFVKSDKAPNLRKFGEEVASQESQFFSLISRAPLAWFQGQVQHYTFEFYTEMNSLEGKWKAMSEQDRSVDDRVRNTSSQVLRLFDEVVKELVAEKRSGEENVKYIVGQAKKVPGVPLPIKVPLIAVDKMLERAGRLKKSSEELAQGYMDAYKLEESIVIVFAQTREGVREFLAKTNLDTAIKEFNAMNENSKGLADQCPTSKQKEDTKRFMEKAANIVSGFLEKFKQEYNEFVDDNRGIFVGPVSDKTLDELLEVRDWQKSWDDIERFNIQSKLKEVYDDCVKTWQVDLDGLTDEQKKELKDYWDMELRRLHDGLYEVIEGSVWDRIKRSHVDNRRQLNDTTKNSKGGLE
ncbi:hypothetical protein NTE_03533 [Candidatus Nitrososphaera evergladensis SR1]|uniref:Uncharacterized protein n=2 Tax=Nitrososphaera TaxID=497726 RepID=A0A075MV86_9ARCH|nr:hypothetical protein NTE_03533 [Candidatus Nitrososphaera evergladensis SR1]